MNEERKGIFRRLGKFSVYGPPLHDFEAMRVLLRDVVVLRCEMRFDIHGLEYLGVSELFDEVPDGQAPPGYDYTLKVTHMDDEPDGQRDITVTFTKIEPPTDRSDALLRQQVADANLDLTRERSKVEGMEKALQAMSRSLARIYIASKTLLNSAIEFQDPPPSPDLVLVKRSEFDQLLTVHNELTVASTEGPQNQHPPVH